MPHVSRNRLSKKAWMKVWQQFIAVFMLAEKDQQLDQVLSKVLTSTEKVMLAKRISLGMLIASGWHTNDIALVLKMSTSTVEKYQAILSVDEEYVQILKNFVHKNGIHNQQREKQKPEFVKSIEELFEDLLVSYRHRSRAYYGRES